MPTVLPAPDEFWTAERCFITELHNAPQSPEASLARARVEPGVTTQLHSLTGVTEVYIVQQGSGLLEIAGARLRLHTGDRAIIPPGTPQRIHNDGAEELVFLCLCTPRFVPAAYVDLESS
ncbi:cupin domain-containing protein [Rhodobacter ferrooxidans]|uniref:Cupin 2 conserved barrel domain protein n=1 Tax=Rhodobacter ferrooxidans TaxID=371731 RepID=C8S293_9RHOB|nr:cupin domain-containing protein [Rhodobacter sp. SW2]EEW24965.1 Cupin 2 conserved barrel domain protein [Rhodobacter sp. SW2]